MDQLQLGSCQSVAAPTKLPSHAAARAGIFEQCTWAPPRMQLHPTDPHRSSRAPSSQPLSSPCLPLQVRNLRPCVKVAFDFLAPTSVHEAAKFAAEVRDICRVQPKVALEAGVFTKAAIRAATAAQGPEQTVPATSGVVYVPPSER